MPPAQKKPQDTVNKPVSYSIKINDKELPTKFKVLTINVDKVLNKISRARICITGGNSKLHKFEESEETIFKPGNDIKISLGYEQKTTQVFEGIIVKHAISLRDGYQLKPWKSFLTLSCADKAIKLTNSFTTTIYEDKKDSEMIISLISSADSSIKKTITATKVKYPFLPKYTINDWDFILERAQMSGLVVINSDNSITIDQPKCKETEPLLEITHGSNTLNFEGEIDASFQFGDLTLLSWDSFKDEQLKSKAVEPGNTKNGDLKGKVLSKSTSPEKTNLHIPYISDSAELGDLSNSFLLESRLKQITGTIKIKGVEAVELSSLIKLVGFGKRFDGSIYVSSVSHQLESGLFTSKIGFGLKKEFINLKKSTDQNNYISSINGIHIGIVTKIDEDPDNQNRIKISIPSLNDPEKNPGEGISIWAQLTHFYTSKEAGSFFIPEVDSQVVVSFLANDPRQPVILGGLYTKTNKPYTTIEKENNLKAFVSKNKLTLEFNEEDKKISISTPNKNSIVISEKDKSITITDENKNKIETSATGITIDSDKKISITSKDKITISGANGVQIDGKSGSDVGIEGNNINLKAKVKLVAKGGSGADLEASGPVNVKGATVNIN